VLRLMRNWLKSSWIHAWVLVLVAALGCVLGQYLDMFNSESDHSGDLSGAALVAVP